mmetsp:Transcript_26842/g.75565  ORF Transcript_26842/g.75565 Transcript_26842/m.75565 type:complete len:286 (-) Transcript_26842:1856-2713(-)
MAHGDARQSGQPGYCADAAHHRPPTALQAIDAALKGLDPTQNLLHQLHALRSDTTVSLRRRSRAGTARRLLHGLQLLAELLVVVHCQVNDGCCFDLTNALQMDLRHMGGRQLARGRCGMDPLGLRKGEPHSMALLGSVGFLGRHQGWLGLSIRHAAPLLLSFRKLLTAVFQGNRMVGLLDLSYERLNSVSVHSSPMRHHASPLQQVLSNAAIQQLSHVRVQPHNHLQVPPAQLPQLAVSCGAVSTGPVLKLGELVLQDGGFPDEGGGRLHLGCRGSVLGHHVAAF